MNAGLIQNRPQTVIVDVRCLQDPSYARRGIGRHALTLLRHAPRDMRLIGLYDPNLPPIIPEARACLSHTARNSRAASAYGVDAFVGLSPMTHDPHFVVPLLEASDLVKVAVVYDFIPHRHPEVYLGTPPARLAYAESLRWLANYDLFCSISKSTGDDLAELLGTGTTHIRTTGSPVDPAFAQRVHQTEGRRDARHLLVVGGPDWRKNSEFVVLAHARSPALQSSATRLVIGGNHDASYKDFFLDVARDAGGRVDLVDVSGRVSDEALATLYMQAYSLIAPSRDEGFDLPVVEGMTAGVPVVGSDIPAHRELLPYPADRFPLDDPAGLSLLMEKLVDDDQRASIVARQTGIWPRYLGSKVGSRFWSAVSERLGGHTPLFAPWPLRNRPPRVALLTPVPPDRSGVADYSATTIAELGQFVELEVFTEATNPAPLPGAASVQPLNAYAHLSSSFDRVVSVLGNSHFHLRIFELLHRYGGAAIAHDARMLGFYRILLGEDRALSAASCELDRTVGSAELNGWLADESSTKALFLGEIFEMATPMIVHSPVTVRLVAERHGAPPAYVPFSIYRPWRAEALGPQARADARRRLGLTEEEVAIVTFGGVGLSKAPEECVWVLDILRRWGVPATLHMVGSLQDMPDSGVALLELAQRLGLADYVRTYDNFVPEQTYRDYLMGANLALQLRTHALGSLSGALIDCAAVGLPTVANQSLIDAAGVPAAYNRGVEDGLSPQLVAEALADLHEAGLGYSRDEDTRHAFSQDRSMTNYASRLCRVLGLDIKAVRLRTAGTVPQ